MADLMNSMNDDIHLSSPLSTTKSSTSHCASCQEEFDYRDDVKTAGNKVNPQNPCSTEKKENRFNLMFYSSATIRHALRAACVARRLINVVHIMNMMVSFIVKEIFMWSKIVSCVRHGKAKMCYYKMIKRTHGIRIIIM